jgi:hypothetical protein
VSALALIVTIERELALEADETYTFKVFGIKIVGMSAFVIDAEPPPPPPDTPAPTVGVAPFPPEPTRKIYKKDAPRGTV